MHRAYELYIKEALHLENLHTKATDPLSTWLIILGWTFEMKHLDFYVRSSQIYPD